jgi:hypothetical protein
MEILGRTRREKRTGKWIVERRKKREGREIRNQKRKRERRARKTGKRRTEETQNLSQKRVRGVEEKEGEGSEERGRRKMKREISWCW